MKKQIKWVGLIIGFISIGMAIAWLVILLSGFWKSQEVRKQIDTGDRYLQEMDYDQAIVAYSAAIEIDEKNVDTRLSLAKAQKGKLTELMEKDQPTEELFLQAEDNLEYLISLDETLSTGYLELADLYLMDGNVEKAKETLQDGQAKTGDAVFADEIRQCDRVTIQRESDFLFPGVVELAEYDAGNNLLRRICIGTRNGIHPEEASTPILKIVPEKNSDGVIIREQWVLEEDSLWLDYEYDEEGRVVKMTGKDPYGNSYVFEYEWNDKGLLAQISQKDNEYVILFEYDSKGLRTKATSYSYGELFGFSEFSYNTDGLLDKIQLLDSFGRVYQEYVPSYDEDGNWVKETLYYYNPMGEREIEEEYVFAENYADLLLNRDNGTNDETFFFSNYYASGSTPEIIESEEYDINFELIRKTINR